MAAVLSWITLRRMSRPRQRFTIDGSDTLEDHLLRTCHDVAAGVRTVVPESQLAGILLGGGYGRGEGGVLRTSVGNQPYNDLEFYVFVRGNRFLAERAFASSLHELGHRLERTAEVPVEFKLINSGTLRGSEPSMFYYDLVAGHKWLLGSEELLARCEHHRDSSAIPLHEATRLLMNRCSGLLFSAGYLQAKEFTAEAGDFVGRNLAKAQLAMGDVLLTAHQQYHWSCLERHARLRRLPLTGELAWAQPIEEHHAAGVEFKLHPVRSSESREVLLHRHGQMVVLAQQLWLWLESRRLGTSFKSVFEYATNSRNKCAHSPVWKNCLLNITTFGPRALRNRYATRYPRERLLTGLALLLFDPAGMSEATKRLALQTALQTRASTWPDLIARYRWLWHRFN